MSDSSTNFQEISSSDNLLKYLKSYRRLENIDYVYHYTTLDSIIKIIESGYWIINNPLAMNDELELEHWDKDSMERIFFISFMKEQKESIGMWSMYAQPWDSGVKISISKKALKKWIKSIDRYYLIRQNEKGKNVVNESRWFKIPKGNKPFLATVAYTNSDDMTGDEERLVCGDSTNKIIKNIYDFPNLTGYIKNIAWSYEKEIRLRFNLDEKYSAIAVKVTDELISDITITKGPRFNGDLEKTIREKFDKEIHTDESLFFNKLSYIYCDKCLETKTGGILA